MSLVVPNVAEVDLLTLFLTPNLTLRLFSNNYVPIAASVAADFTEVAGGGYANKALVFGSWTIVAGAPTTASYAQQTFTFTGVTTAPSTIYGYYVTRVSDGLLLWAERFDASAVPFTPLNGSTIKITPQFTGDSVF